MGVGVSPGELAALTGALLAAGFATGLLAGLLGIGGGGILVPVLYEVFGSLGVDEAVRMHLAVGTSLAVIVPTSLRSFAGHRARGAVDMDLVRSMALPVVAGVVLGAVLARYANDAVLKGIWVGGREPDSLKLFFGRQDWRLGEVIPGQPFRAHLWRLRGPALDPDEHRRRRVHHRADDLLWPPDPARDRDLVRLRPDHRDPGRAWLHLGGLACGRACRRARSATSACSARC